MESNSGDCYQEIKDFLKREKVLEQQQILYIVVIVDKFCSMTMYPKWVDGRDYGGPLLCRKDGENEEKLKGIFIKHYYRWNVDLQTNIFGDLLFHSEWIQSHVGTIGSGKGDASSLKFNYFLLIFVFLFNLNFK